MTGVLPSLRQEKTDPRSENRVVGSPRSSAACAGSILSEPVELRQENGSIGTATVSGVWCWLAKDPILFGGGQANLYLYCHGDSINYFDPWGLGEYQGTLVAGLTLILTPDFVTLDPSDAAWLKWAVYAGAFAAAWTLDNVIDIFRNSNPNQDKLLDNKEADKVAQEHGYKNAEDAKDQLGAGGKHDIYIRPDGTPVIKPKGGDGPGEPL